MTDSSDYLKNVPRFFPLGSQKLKKNGKDTPCQLVTQPRKRIKLSVRAKALQKK